MFEFLPLRLLLYCLDPAVLMPFYFLLICPNGLGEGENTGESLAWQEEA